MKRKKVCLIGRVAPEVPLFDGQTIKTRILYNELKKKSNWNIHLIDTYHKNHKIRLLLKTIFNLIKCRDVIISLSQNGLTTYYKILKVFIKIRKTRVYHCVIGGSHHIYLQEHPKFIKTNKKFMVNWVESQMQINELNKMGIYNTKYLPNFKPIDPINEKDLIYCTKPPFKFVTFSRVTKTKGIDTAADAIDKINRKYGREVCHLDVYGVIEDDFKDEFSKLISKNKYVSYKGITDPLKSKDVIKNYFMLLFPTYWPSEGFAGTILDAYFGGVPVIASDWNCNCEIVKNNKTGFIYPNNEYNFKDLFDCVFYAIENSGLINDMKKNCVEYAKQFKPDKYIDEIIEFINRRG